ncbi:MAG: hypothetical protein WCO09_02320 [bacterium]
MEYSFADSQMKKTTLALLALFASIFCVTTTVAQEVKLTLGGFASFDYGTDQPVFSPDRLHYREISTTCRPIVTMNYGQWVSTFEANFSDVVIEDCNWLRQAWVGYRFPDNLTISAGRIVTTNVYLVPTGADNPIARCPRYPIGFYAWGAQLKKRWDNFTLIADVTGDSTTPFQNKASWQGVESSVRMTYAFNPTWNLSFSTSHVISAKMPTSVRLTWNTRMVPGPFGSSGTQSQKL